MHRSIWKETELTAFPTLRGDRRTDVLIVGGGVCGVLCAYYLRQAGVDCLLVEGDRIGSGISGNTTGKVTWLHGLIYRDLMFRSGREGAQMYLSAQRQALAQYEKLAEQYDFDYERRAAYTYSMKDRSDIEEEAIALRALGAEVHFSPCDELPFKTRGGLRADGQGQMDIMKFLGAISKDLPILEHTFVRELSPGKAVSDRGVIKAKNVIVATHFPFVDRYGAYFVKQYQHRSYLLALRGAPRMQGMYVDEAKEGMTFRSKGDLLLIGGGGHRTGKRGGGYAKLQQFVQTHYPDARIVASWAAQDCMTLDSVPYIGPYSPKTPGMFVATGFNKWGLTGSMVAALLLSDLVQGKRKDWDSVFSPRRSILHPTLLVNGLETVGNLLLPLPRRCSHLGCALHYNKAEHSWDCPCHGSRFDEKGKVLDNPANRPTNV